MPFEVFRRHQRKMLAVFAIMAMFGFVLSDSLPRLLNGNTSGARDNPVIATLYGETIRRTDLTDIAMKRQAANRFMANLIGFLLRRAPSGQFFGDYTDRSLVDALILENQANEMGLPRDAGYAKQWLSQLARSADSVMTREVFELALAPLADQYTGGQVLESVAEEVRRLQVQRLLSTPLVTPLDVYESYRDQNERVAIRAAAFPVDRFLDKVPDPTDAQVESFYAKYKDALPDPARETPGFKLPRQVVVEFLVSDGAKLAEQIKAKLADEELRTYFENRKSDFVIPSELPDDLFADDRNATLTPALTQPFEQVREQLASALAEERAQGETVDAFAKVKEEQMFPFADRYQEAVEDAAEAKKDGRQPRPLPSRPDDLTAVAAQAGMTREVSPPLTREAADRFGRLGDAQVGMARFSDGRRFAEEVFDAKNQLFEPFELTAGDRTRFLVRKLEDTPPRVPPLTEIRVEVVAAWKQDQARELARKAADTFAEAVRKDGGKIKDEIVEGRPVVVTDPIARMQPGMPLPDQMFQTGPPTPSLLPEFPYAGTELRDAMFGLGTGDVAVAPNAPRTAFYVLTLDRRDPAGFERLFGPSGTYALYQREAMGEASNQRESDWMGQLRLKAGLEPGWIPEDERERAATDSAS